MYRSNSTSKARRGLGGLVALLVITLLGLIPVASVAAADDPTDMVLEWNINAINAIGNPGTAAIPGLGQSPPIAVIHQAMVHGAIYDAVNAIDGGHTPYLGGLPAAPSTASKAAAVATAAHDVLVALPPGSAAVTASVGVLYSASLTEIALAGVDPADISAGIAIGHAAAAAIVANRVGDGRFAAPATWPIGTQPGEWRSVPTNNSNVFAWVGNVRPFTMTSTDQFRTEGPPDMTSAEYAIDFNEVKSLGAQGSNRTPEQNLLASFVSANPFTYFNRGLREIAVANGLSTTEQALLFVKTSMSAADALIGCFNDKDHWLLWRPQTAIRLADTDGNAATEVDLNWTALYQNPGYPDHPSGYNCFAGATWNSAKAFFGTNRMDFSLTSPGTAPLPGSTRTYKQFTAVVHDAIEGRILIGYHFRFADVQGAWIGKKAAQWLDKHYFQPVD